MPRDAISPIDNPRFTPSMMKIGDSEYSRLESEDLVIGVEINGESKAYPVGFLTYREMINDVVGGVAILVTWEPASYTGLVHDRRIDGQTYTFGNQGALFVSGMTYGSPYRLPRSLGSHMSRNESPNMLKENTTRPMATAGKIIKVGASLSKW